MECRSDLALTDRHDQFHRLRPPSRRHRRLGFHAIGDGTVNGRQLAVTAAAAGSGLAGGVFFGFSTFVMSALRKLPPAQGIAAMQSINRQAPTPPFMTLLFGTAALSAGLGLHAVMHRDQPASPWVGIGTIAYLAAIVITAGFHVPRNDKLANFDVTTNEAAQYWTTYLTQWTTGNHLRTAACAVATVAYTCAATLSQTN